MASVPELMPFAFAEHAALLAGGERGREQCFVLLLYKTRCTHLQASGTIGQALGSALPLLSCSQRCAKENQPLCQGCGSKGCGPSWGGGRGDDLQPPVVFLTLMCPQRNARGSLQSSRPEQLGGMGLGAGTGCAAVSSC